MLDINYIIDNLELVKQGTLDKNVQVDFDRLLELDQERRQLIQVVDNLRAEKNAANQKLSQLKGPDKQTAIAEMKKVSEQEKINNEQLQKVEKEWKDIMLQIPNPPSKTTPIGKTEDDNIVASTYGKIPEFDFEPKDHVELGKLTDTIEIEAAAISSGSRFNYLKNEAVLIQFALVQYILQKLTNKGFTPVVPPVLVREEAMYATGFFPADREQIYHVNPTEDDLYLVGTSEVPLTMLHYKQTLDASKLPLRYVGYSTCFRREAGTYGKDTHGILRVHQFDKIEMYSFCHPDKSEEEHELIRSLEEEIMQDLKLPYQLINICSGDLGNPATKKYDLEVWIPSQNQYRELTSTSNCTDYQARRSQIKYKDQNGKTTNLHTLNGTACAIGRTLIAIYENYQNADGSITVPEILRPYVGKSKIEVKN
jgi:seryl-tRNA synthetase